MTYEELKKQDELDLRTVFELKEGRRFLARLIDLCGMFRSSYSGEEINAMILKEGMRNVALNILSALTGFDDDAFHKLYQAALERNLDEDEEQEEL